MLKRVCLLSLLFPLTAVASSQIPAKKQDHPIALVGGTVHTVAGGEIAGGIVVFENGKITAVGKDVSIPAGAEKIDVSGKHIYPGLIDASTILGLTEIEAVRATNDRTESGKINPNVRVEVAVNPDGEAIPVSRSNGVTLALTSPSGGHLAGTSALIYMDGWTWEEMLLKAPVAMHLSWPNMLPVTAWWMREPEEKQIETRDKTIAEIHQAFADARAYAAAKKSGAKIEIDARWEAMIPVLDGKMPVMVDANELTQIKAAVTFAAREKLRLIIRGGLDAALCADLLKEHDVPVIIDGTHRVPQRDDDAYDAPFAVAEQLRKAGVRFCIAGGGESANVRNLPYQAAMAAAFGLPKDEALKSITLYPAQILGVAERVGSIEAGKDATLIVTTGDPLEIPSSVQLEFIRGRRIDLGDKQKTLWEKYKEKQRQTVAGER